MFNKFLFRLFVLFALFAFIFTSCSKDNITKRNNAINNSKDEIRNVAPGGSDPTYLLDKDANEWCTTGGTNCASTCTITAKKDANIKTFEIAISNGSNGVSDGRFKSQTQFSVYKFIK